MFLHAGALLAFVPSFFSWPAVGVMLFLHWLTASLGICLGYHRYLTHRGMTLPRWLGYFLVFCGSLACENGPIKWTAQHRMHHAGSDTDRDPHSAKKGFWWAHFLWMINKHHLFDDPKYYVNYAKDISDNRFYRFLDNYFILNQFVFGFLLYALGGLPFVVWGVFVRLVLVYHSTWFVNSAAHFFGYQNFPLKDDLSTNCWWVALISYGEGWHNNHHAFPKSSRHGLRRREIDMTWWAIWVLKKLGLATHIQVAKLTRTPAQADTPGARPRFSGEMVKQAA